MTKIHEDPRQQNRSNLAGPIYQDTYTSKNDDSFLHLDAGHDLVAPYDSEQRRRNEWCLYWVYKMILLHNNIIKWVTIGYTKRF